MDFNRASFASAYPQGFFVDLEDRAALESYLRRKGWIAESEALLSAAKAGEGNMNLTLRVVTATKSFILKQARPWVEKYPGIAAPPERALVEIAFYRAVSSRPAIRSAMPALLGEDRASGILVLEDLGAAQDFTSLYRGERLSEPDLDALVSYAVELHRPFEGLGAIFENRGMRALNHEHIFRFPLERENGLDLDAISPGLDRAARRLKGDGAYVARVTELGGLYLEDGRSLVHGDYFPGSWLATSAGARVIDPEFCFLGVPAFDLGVMLAHLHLSSQPRSLCDALLDLYRSRAGVGTEFVSLARQFAGVEIMRRLIGVAQLPLPLGLDERLELLDLSKRLV
ncbi:MAG: phosphotransferase [Vicinamibacteria bacterium]